ncbi:phage shock protein operon transcriptional activator [Sphingoaurantiacus capsulatus]|uniref:Phage shock protein operon transcriptional activator n=1 Tax=Sphingoaurantiacus capsulatus TaxID=1771310 RepID=A0ABV7X7R2_9SPHN
MQKATTLVGQSTAFLDAVERASQAAALTRPVLVIGERGTGKELIAERLHHLSPRWDGPLVTLNCAALPENLIDAELFGYEAGAFTGAQKSRAGRFEDADGGTLFLDEIGTLSAAAQERLLRVVEYGELTRLGSNRPVQVDVRVVGATNEDLPLMVEKGRFRPDLLDRLSFEVITLPPLRVRAEDIMILAEHFARRMAMEIGWMEWPGFSPDAKKALKAYPWPGNIRELKNAVERAVYRWGDPVNPIAHIPFDPFDSPWRPKTSVSSRPDHVAAIADPRPSVEVVSANKYDCEKVADLRVAVAEYERDILAAALARCRFNQRETATMLKLSYDQLRHCLRRHGMLEKMPDKLAAPVD